jgi:serine/threonine-protein kinase HipA
MARYDLGLVLGRYDISREAMLADAVRFGFSGREAAASYLDALLLRIEHAYGQVEGILSPGLQALLRRRMRDNIDLLR